MRLAEEVGGLRVAAGLQVVLGDQHVRRGEVVAQCLVVGKERETAFQCIERLVVIPACYQGLGLRGIAAGVAGAGHPGEKGEQKDGDGPKA